MGSRKTGRCEGAPPGRRRTGSIKICANFGLLRTLVRAIFAAEQLYPYPLSTKTLALTSTLATLVNASNPWPKKTMREGVLGEHWRLARAV